MGHPAATQCAGQTVSLKTWVAAVDASAGADAHTTAGLVTGATLESLEDDNMTQCQLQVVPL